jgi:hypothetical protein
VVRREERLERSPRGFAAARLTLTSGTGSTNPGPGLCPRAPQVVLALGRSDPLLIWWCGHRGGLPGLLSRGSGVSPPWREIGSAESFI